MSAQRVFSAEFLVQAGRPTIDLITEALDASDFERLAALLEQFYGEVRAMLFGYISWPKVIRSFVESRLEETAWQEMDVTVRQALAAELPPARQVFTQWEVTYSALQEAVNQQDAKNLALKSRQWHEHALAVHDNYMNYAALLVSELARRFGSETMQQVLTQVMDLDAMGLRPDMPFRQRAETLIEFTRLHLLPFRLVEDDEKLTFIADPCPSGGRQVLAGLYAQSSPGEVITGESPATYGRAELPSYCCHESALEIASIHRFGSPVFIVDPAAELGRNPCHVYLYKEPAAIPERFYHRVGLGDLIARG
jgi:hypothetical protein